MQSISPLPLPLVPIAMDAQRTPVKRIIKLGGAAITNKECFETLQHEVLATSCQQIAACAQDVLCDTVVVHGAGSYGHMQACQYKVAAGGDLATNTALRMGFTLTRQSVTKLNHLVVAELVRTGLPACGMSPCGYWFTDNRQVGSTAHRRSIMCVLSRCCRCLMGIHPRTCVCKTRPPLCTVHACCMLQAAHVLHIASSATPHIAPAACIQPPTHPAAAGGAC
jgi:hypothetical protein